MNISKKIISSILIILVFFSLLIPNTSQASIFDDDEDEAQSEIEETIDNDDGGLCEKIIAKLIGGIAATIFDLTTNEDFGMGFKNYDELIFAKDATVISPFTDEQWDSMMDWYKIMSSIAGSIIFIAVVVVAYKMIISGYSAEHRTERGAFFENLHGKLTAKNGGRLPGKRMLEKGKGNNNLRSDKYRDRNDGSVTKMQHRPG